MEFEIRNFEDLIHFLESNELTERQTNDILTKTIQSLYTGDTSNKKEMITALREFWKKWSGEPEKPLFIDLNIPDVD